MNSWEIILAVGVVIVGFFLYGWTRNEFWKLRGHDDDDYDEWKKQRGIKKKGVKKKHF